MGTSTVGYAELGRELERENKHGHMELLAWVSLDIAEGCYFSGVGGVQGGKVCSPSLFHTAEQKIV